MIVKREVMHIVVAQQEDNLIGMTIAEGDNVNQTLHGGETVYVLIGIGIDIIPQEDNPGVVAWGNSLAPELAAMDIGYNQYLVFHATLILSKKDGIGDS